MLLGRTQWILCRGVEGRTLRNTEIVLGKPTDGDALRDVHVATWAATYQRRVPHPFYEERLAQHRVQDWDQIVRRQSSSGGGVLVAKSGGRITGFCQYGPSEEDGEDPALVGHIHRLYVEPARQRTGVGRALLAVATDRLRQEGTFAATLWVLESDDRARAFYEALGWKPNEKRKSSPTADLEYRLLLA
jgi:GNAT superfamily N-acetyltransferase